MGKKNHREPNSPVFHMARKPVGFDSRKGPPQLCRRRLATFKNSSLTDLAPHIVFEEI
jgi:hypothetical protein